MEESALAAAGAVALVASIVWMISPVGRVRIRRFLARTIAIVGLAAIACAAYATYFAPPSC
ncbi:hypothetical protein [Phytomonospora endophytica]|uniref:Uncharacterized membrane protein YebE (DUF533 family) n=1 Tax=Phytomonospora endophytica TaxID=714109 RepID=A0A841G234_9ACTN|nr:hypothetical protein [Phytomonospora endophytica]MBB6038210.1 uncharacterized membrane protein YebE (DUF533 family) [Phytomonospora endophytica]GIG67332.1 hypothetical protein Pen01_36270 [Phytomonospora endophytica]